MRSEPRDESVEAKWEHLQYYETHSWSKTQQGENGGGVDQVSVELGQVVNYPYSDVFNPNSANSRPQDSSYSSMASGSSSESSSAATTTSTSSVQPPKTAKARFQKRWKKLRNQFALAVNPNSRRMNSTTSYNDFPSAAAAGATTSSAVSTTPNGGGSSGVVGGVIPRLRASKSMQNLEQITRDSYYNMRDATANLKEKYHSRLELRQARPKAEYQVRFQSYPRPLH